MNKYKSKANKYKNIQTNTNKYSKNTKIQKHKTNQQIQEKSQNTHTNAQKYKNKQ